MFDTIKINLIRKMNTNRSILPYISVSFCFLFFCMNNVKPIDSPVVRIQEWKLIESNTSNYADINLNTHQNGSISCDGIWYYYYAGKDVTCKNFSGSVHKDTTFLSINCSGNASYLDKYGIEVSSGFYLNFRGQFKNESSSGYWKISFDEPDWDDNSPGEGNFEGNLTYERIVAQ